jgi:branched-chain amino acid transport system substrate-binding protein
MTMIGRRKVRVLAPAVALAAVLVLATTAAAGVRGPAKSEAPAEFKLGVLVPLTGALALPGSRIRTAINYAVDEINKRGGIDGRRITVVIVDDAGDPTQDVAGATKLINQDRVDFIFGPITSDGQLAVLPLQTRAKIASIGVVGSPRLTPQVMPYGFSVLLNAGEQASRLVAWARAKNYKSVAILHDSGEQGKTANEVLKRDVAAKGIRLTGEQEYNVGATDVTAQLLSLKRGNPRALLLYPTSGTDTGRVLQGMDQLNWNIPVIAGYGAHFGPDVARVAGRPSMARLVATTYMPFGKCANAGVPPNTKAFINGIRRFAPDQFASLTPALDLAAAVRDGVWIIKRAVEGANSTSGDRVATWLERNSKNLGRGLVNPRVSASRNSHFLFGPSNMALVKPGTEPTPGVYARVNCPKKKS